MVKKHGTLPNWRGGSAFGAVDLVDGGTGGPLPVVGFGGDGGGSSVAGGGSGTGGSTSGGDEKFRAGGGEVFGEVDGAT